MIDWHCIDHREKLIPDFHISHVDASSNWLVTQKHYIVWQAEVVGSFLCELPECSRLWRESDLHHLVFIVHQYYTSCVLVIFHTKNKKVLNKMLIFKLLTV